MTETLISLPVTALVAAVFGILMVPLSLQISLHYANRGTSQADPNIMRDELLRRKTLAHGNFIEYVPTALILLGLMEASGAPDTLLWLLGGSFLGARILHIISQMYTSGPALRGAAMVAGHIYFLVSAGWLIRHYI